MSTFRNVFENQKELSLKELIKNINSFKRKNNNVSIWRRENGNTNIFIEVVKGIRIKYIEDKNKYYLYLKDFTPSNDLKIKLQSEFTSDDYVAYVINDKDLIIKIDNMIQSIPIEGHNYQNNKLVNGVVDIQKHMTF